MNTETTNPRTFIREALNTGARVWVHWNYCGEPRFDLIETEGYVLSATRTRFTVQDGSSGDLVEIRYEFIVEMLEV